MANPGYVRSTDGSDADNGSTWALANATLAGAITDGAAGDRIYVSDAHAESTAATTTLTFPGTLAAPNTIVCGDDVAEPPTAVTTTGTITFTGTSVNLTVNGSLYMYGVGINMGAAGGTSNNLNLNQSAAMRQVYEDCTFTLVATGSGGTITVHSASNINSSETEWLSCDVKLGATTQEINVQAGAFFWRGGSFLSGSSTPAAGVIYNASTSSKGPVALVENVDLSNLATTLALVGSAGPAMKVVFRNCKLPASWAGTLFTGTLYPGVWAGMFNCDAGDTNYTFWVEMYGGSIKQETVVVRTGTLSTAKHNTAEVPLSARFAMAANAEYPVIPCTFESAFFNETTSAQTATFSLLSFTSTALTDADIGVKLNVLATSGATLGTQVSSLPASILTTASSLATDTGQSWDSKATAYSSATNYVVGDIIKPSAADGSIHRLETDAGTTAAEPTWTTTDGATTVDATGRTWRRCRRQKIAVAFTAAEQGPVTAVIEGFLASTTIYVDPVPVLT